VKALPAAEPGAELRIQLAGGSGRVAADHPPPRRSGAPHPTGQVPGLPALIAVTCSKSAATDLMRIAWRQVGGGGDPGRGDALAEVDRFATDASRDAPIARRNPAAKTGVPGSRVAPGCRGADRGANWSRPRPEEQLKHPTAES